MSNEVSAGQPQIWTGCHNICHCFARPRFIAFPHTHTHAQEDNNNNNNSTWMTVENANAANCAHPAHPSASASFCSFSFVLLADCNYASCRWQPRGEFLSDFVFDKWLWVRYPLPAPSSKDNSSTCVCLAFVCTFPLTLEQEAILPLPASASTHCQNSVYSAIYCATFVIIIAMQQTSLLPSLLLHSPPLSLSLFTPCLASSQEAGKKFVRSAKCANAWDGKTKAKRRRRSSSSREEVRAAGGAVTGTEEGAAAACRGVREADSRCSWRSRRRWQHTHNCK